MQQGSSASINVSSLKTSKSEASKSPAGLVWAYRVLWFTFIMFFLSTGLGKLWDRVWHLTHRFDTFWSPPHLFVSTMTATTGFLVITLAFLPYFRSWFGPFIHLPLINVKVAGSLVLLGGSLVSLSTSIMLDFFWHTVFGFDETQWSLPHNMIVMSWLLIILGFVSCRLAFRQYRPLSWLTNLVLAMLILGFLCPAILGPFYLNYSPNLLHALASVPVNLAQASVRHLYRIYFASQLSRQTNPLFIPFVTFFAGIALALLRSLDGRARIFLLAPLLLSLIFMVRDWYTLYFLHYHGVTHIKDLLPVLLQEPSLWVPIPLFAAGLIDLTLRKIGLSEFWTEMTTGAIFGILVFFIWHSSPIMILLAIPAGAIMVLSSTVGRWIYRVLEKPRWSHVLILLFTACSELPAFFGAVDLILRRTIP